MSHKRPYQYQRLSVEPITISSAAAGCTSLAYPFEGADEIHFVVGMGTAAANLQTTFSAYQTGSLIGGTTATIGGASAVIGSTAANLVTKARAMLITISSNATDNDKISINGTTFTNATAVSATALTFGATAGATAAGGCDPIVTSLTSLINANISGVTATTQSTAVIMVRVKEGYATSINSTGHNNLVPSYVQAESVVTVRAADLNSTSKYVGISFATVATAVRMAVAVIRTSPRYSDSTGSYQAISVST